MSGPPSLPLIRRARDFHLYDERGRRYLDLYQNGGRAILSHRPPGLAKRIKGVVDQGLWGPFPSVWTARLERVLGELCPDHPVVRVYAHTPRAVEVAGGTVADPALGAGADGAGSGPAAAWWRPFLPPDLPEGAARRPRVLLPVLPFPAAFAPQPLCAAADAREPLPPSDPVSPVLLAGLTQAAHLLAGAGRRDRTGNAAPAGGRRGSRGGGAAAAVDPLTLFDERELGLWRRRGPYLELRCAPERFDAVFSAFLEAGIIINPAFPGPSILPRRCSRGEFEKFVKVSRMADS